MNSDERKGGSATLDAVPPTTTAPPPQPEAPSTPTQNPPAQSQQYRPYLSAPAPYGPAEVQRRPGRQGRHSTWLAWVIGGTLGALVLGGLLIALIAALLGGIFASTIGQNEQTATATRSFTVSGTPSLVITNTAGNITVQSSGSGSQVVVQVTKHAWGSSVAVARSGLDNTAVTLSQSGNTIAVATQFTSTYFDGGMARRTVDLLVTVPSQTNADLRLSAGNIEMRQVSGTVQVDASAGNVTTHDVTLADGSQLHTSVGNLTLDGAIASGATVDVTVSTGNATLTLPAATPAHLDASTSVGNLTIIGWPISVSGTGLTGHHASGDLGPNPSARLMAQVSTGNLTLRSR